MATLPHVDNSIAASSALVFFYLAMKIIPTFNAVNDFKSKVAAAAGPIQDIEYVLHRSDHFEIEKGTKKFPGLKRGIEVKNLTFSFEGNSQPTLSDVSCFIEAGKTTAVVGPSGSGKSTLFNIWLRFYDCPEGTVFFDGHDVRDYTIPSVRTHMSFVGQESLMFNDTIMHNMKYGRNAEMADMEDGALDQVARDVRIEDLIKRMPQGYHTSVGERGSKLSGGEKQRVSIARALIKDPEMIFFDEATSALDSRTEENISNYIYQAYGGKTKFIIAHRLSTIAKADKIIYLEQGRVVEEGTFAELVALRGELQDRYGPPPDPMRNLLYGVEVKLRAGKAGATVVRVRGAELRIVLARDLGDAQRTMIVSVFPKAQHGQRQVRASIVDARGDWRDALTRVLEGLAA